MERSKEFACDVSRIQEAVEFAGGILTREKVTDKERAATLLKLENVLECLINRTDRNADTFTVTVIRRFRQIRVILQCKGAEINVRDFIPDLGLGDVSEETAAILKSKMLPILTTGLHTAYRFGTNRITLTVCNQKMNRIVFNMLCVLIGTLIGLLLKAILPVDVSLFFANEVLGTVINAFFNLLKMIVAPLVFFSIITGISGFEDTRELGKIGIKTVALFVVFSIIGLFVGLGVFAVLPSGSPEIMDLAGLDTGKVTATVSAWQSFKDLILSFFPSNLLGAFVNNDILAVIFLAVLFGVCTNKLRPEFSSPLHRATDSLNELMCGLATMIVSAMPFIILCSMVKMMITVEFSSAVILLKLLLSFLVVSLIMLGIYCAVLALNGISPVFFFKNYAPAVLSGVTLASSSATVPVSLKCCTDGLKIPPMITYFVVPLGSTINMNGSCILLTLICLFTANVFGITPTAPMLIPALCMILLLSMAAPGVPGSLIIMLASILPMLGIPAEAAQLSICISPFIGMLLVPVNCTGDAVTAMLIHKGRQRRGGK